MRFIHLSDLHIGKRVNEISMIEDQEYILTAIIRIIDEQKPDAVIIAGDVYDKSVPSAEAVTLFDDFLCRLAKRSLPLIIISGNHDSAERLAFGGRLMEGAGVHVSPVYSGGIEPVELYDSHGVVKFWPLPFVKPAHVRRWYPDECIESYTDALRVALSKLEINPAERNVLITHQFVTGAETCESEELSVGGTDNVSAEVFEAFDYVALGHIHGPQNVGSERIRYCGTPLKYSFSEAGHKKSVTVVELGAKGELEVSVLPLVPRRDMREIKGTYDELSARSFYEGTAVDDYLHVILTDEEDVPEAIGRLRVIYPNIMKLSYDNARTRSSNVIAAVAEVQRKSQLDLLEELYELQNDRPMSSQQRSFAQQLIEEIWEDER